MKSPAVSICVPTHNRAAYLREALQSVLAQTYVDFEIVVCDNASTDETARIVSRLADPRIRYVRQEAPLGVAANWIAAVFQATGRYCAILGDDDRWAPTFLEKLLPPLQGDPQLDVSFCDHWIIDSAGTVLSQETEACSRIYKRASLRPGAHRPFLKVALNDQAIPVAAALMRRSRLVTSGALDRRAGLVIDYYLFARLALAGGGAFYQPERLASVRRHAGSGSSTRFPEIWPDLQWVCADLNPHAPGPRERSYIRKKWAHAIFWDVAALVAKKAWGELPRTLGAVFARIPAASRLQLSFMTLLVAFSTGLNKVQTRRSGAAVN
jgi:glycosyltransferase involved in cell wall biosynthesis